MPRYIEKALKWLQCKPKVSPQYSPHTHIHIQYATTKTRQYATAPETSPLLDPKEIKHIQSITGSFLYYDRALENTILPDFNEIASAQSKPTGGKQT